MFRKVTAQDQAALLELMREFYHSPAVLHPVPDSYFQRTLQEVTQNSPYAQAFLFYHEEQLAGYGLLAKTYSNEAGGLVIWLEEAYIRPDFRGHGIGSAFFRFIEETYAGQAARLRLEVEPDNEAAVRLYRRLGFQDLPYKQMIKELL